jgi:hydroxymethylpyrimidine pyrophosphatase-like HAD family hydrolase
MSKEATKENALLDIFAQEDINSEEVVVFGDGLNDLGLIRTFGWGIAVANAKRELKDAVTYTTLSNDENGVSYALREILRVI